MDTKQHSYGAATDQGDWQRTFSHERLEPLRTARRFIHTAVVVGLLGSGRCRAVHKTIGPRKTSSPRPLLGYPDIRIEVATTAALSVWLIMNSHVNKIARNPAAAAAAAAAVYTYRTNETAPARARRAGECRSAWGSSSCLGQRRATSSRRSLKRRAKQRGGATTRDGHFFFCFCFPSQRNVVVHSQHLREASTSAPGTAWSKRTGSSSSSSSSSNSRKHRPEQMRRTGANA